MPTSPDIPQTRTAPKPLSVTELTHRIKSTLEGGFSAVDVQGEISNMSRPASGHLYFTIKDANAQISAVMFRGNQRGMQLHTSDGRNISELSGREVTLLNGIEVRARGSISVYAPRGNYQIIVRSLEESGKGSLQAQFEKLKQKLKEEGLFDKERKKPLPLLPQHVGIVTSDTGAAIRDILNVVSRRFPNIHILLAPAKVQGAGAAEEIAAAIDRLNRIGGLDVLIVGRGGGSLEDLWCFNEEIVARAIARSEIPIISAVGHEIDFTISDFVADLRAPTPSAAAEIVVGRKDAFEEQIQQYSSRLIRTMRERLHAERARLQRVADSYVFREPANIARRYREKLQLAAMRSEHRLRDAVRETRQTIDLLDQQMETSIHRAINETRQKIAMLGAQMQPMIRNAATESRQQLEHLRNNMAHRMQLRLQLAQQDIRRYKTQLRALNPLAVLQRGYSVTRDSNGNIISKTTNIKTGETITTQLSDGTIESTVSKIYQQGETT